MGIKAKIITVITLTSIFGFVSPAQAAEAPSTPAAIQIATVSGAAGSLASE